MFQFVKLKISIHRLDFAVIPTKLKVSIHLLDFAVYSIMNPATRKRGRKYKIYTGAFSSHLFCDLLYLGLEGGGHCTSVRLSGNVPSDNKRITALHAF